MSRSTKQLLSETFIKLLNEKQMNKISVSEVAEHSGVSRMTFYYHFKDIYDLVGWTFVQRLRDSIDTFCKNNKVSSSHDILLQVFCSILEQKDFIQDMYNCMDHVQVTDFLLDIIMPFIHRELDEISQGYEISDEDAKFIELTSAHVLVSMTYEWTSRGMTQTPDEFVNFFERIINGCLILMVKNAAQTNSDK